MSRPSRVSRSSIGIVGGGAAGTLTAARLIDEAGRRHSPLELTLVEPRDLLGRGVAYSTGDNRHLLNVPARSMTAYPEDADHFVRWLEAHDGRPVDPCAYVPRARYGQYLAHVLDEARRRTPWVEVFHVRDRVVDLVVTGQRCQLWLESGAHVDVEAAILALGHLGTEASWVPPALWTSSRFLVDPWAPGALTGVDPDGDVLLVGSGLTMVDTMRVLDRPGRTLHATSRHGVLPRRHRPGQLPLMEAPEMSASPTLAEMHAVMPFHAAKAVERYGDWRPAIDSIRVLSQRIWAGFTDAERADFVAFDARWWESVRHRIPPASADALDAARAGDRFEMHTGSVVDAVERPDGLEVVLSDGATVRVGAVVNCTGPCQNPDASHDPLVRSLLDAGIARGGPLGIGFDTSGDGQLLDADGALSHPIWALGSLRRGTLWESTAMPEIREQAASLATCVLGAAPLRDTRPRDRFGLGLSTTADAAAAWNSALHAISTLQSGAEASLREAVQADPGFAMGHAALALVGHEWGAAAVDVEASLHAAVDTAQHRGDARERSFVQTVSTRLTGPTADGDRDLLRHVSEYPLDAFAVSMALPSIAFSGLTQPVEQSWALADRLALSYGDDWWFAGVLAFVRQDQERWDDAARLAARSLLGAAGAGHAAHAMTHVFYETGDHAEGLRWLDRWIDSHAAGAQYGAHFSWHAALHELALDDAEAVRRRYVDQLAPPVVIGPRALVDSASLLWRSRLSGLWQGELPIEDVLATVPECLLDHPSTAFAAMHAVVGLAAAGDVDALDRLCAFAADYPDPAYRELIVPLCEGFSAAVRGEPMVAAQRLALVLPQAKRLGGSAAQQEVIAETMVHALVQSGQRDAARRFLEERLDRRASPLDRRQLAALAGPKG